MQSNAALPPNICLWSTTIFNRRLPSIHVLWSSFRQSGDMSGLIANEDKSLKSILGAFAS